MQSSNIEGSNQTLLTHLQLMDIFSNTVHLYKKINKQEDVCTSAAGKGIACPHSISIEIDELTCVLGISHKGIDYNSPDGHDCLFILLTLSPVDESTKQQKFINRFQTLVQNTEICDSLYKSENSNEILNIISQWEENENKRDNLLQ